MACESFYTTDLIPDFIDSTMVPPDSWGTNRLNYIVDALNTLVVNGDITCMGAATTLDEFLASANISIDGTVFLPPTTANFSCPGGNGVLRLTLQLFGNFVGYLECTFTAGVPTLVNSGLWNSPIVIGTGVDSFGCGVNTAGTRGDTITFSYPFSGITAFSTTQDFVNCAVGACSIAPTALPSSPGAIKSANFTRIFNPLNLPLRSK